MVTMTVWDWWWYLALFVLDEAEDIIRQVEVFRSGVREDIDEGVRKWSLQRHLYPCDAHLRTVASSLYVQVPQDPLEQLRVRCHRYWSNHWTVKQSHHTM